MVKNVWKDGILGAVIADAMGVPVEFTSREELAQNPVNLELIINLQALGWMIMVCCLQRLIVYSSWKTENRKLK